MAAILFSGGVAFLAIGLLWFYVLRPILEDFGIISVSDYEQPAPALMSRVEDDRAPSMPSSLQTDSRQTSDKAMMPVPSRDIMLNTYKLLRKYGIPREEARPVLKAAGLPLDNNLWVDAAPPEPEHLTPIVGRPTSARFDITDPDYPYQAPAT